MPVHTQRGLLRTPQPQQAHRMIPLERARASVRGDIGDGESGFAFSHAYRDSANLPFLQPSICRHQEISMSHQFRPMAILIVCLLSASAAVTLFAHANGSLQQGKSSTQQDRIAIERLHQQDVDATLSGKADEFAKLWDSDAVRIGPGQPAEIGKAAIYATDKREEDSGEGQSLCYKPEIQDLQITGDWAFEWGYFSYKQSANARPMRGKVLSYQTPAGWFLEVRACNRFHREARRRCSHVCPMRMSTYLQ